MRPPGTIEQLDILREEVAMTNLRFERLFIYVILSIFAWNRFWQHADRLADNAHAQVLAWSAVVVAILVAYNL